MVGSVAQRLKERGIALSWDDKVLQYLARRALIPPTVRVRCAVPFSAWWRTISPEEILSGRIKLGDTVRMGLAEDHLTFTPVPQQEAAPASDAEG